MTSRTIFLGRLIGLLLIVSAGSLMSHPVTSIYTVSVIVHAPELLMVFGILATAAGLAIVLSHNRWSGGAPTVIVTLVGWLTLIRGLAIMFFSPGPFVVIFESLQFEQFFFFYLSIPLILGAYLTWTGFRAKT
jgi:hypothetical protein